MSRVRHACRVGHRRSRVAARHWPAWALPLAAVAAAFLGLALPLGPVEPAAGDAAGTGPGWEFVPLGPEGADLAAIVSLPEGGWLALAPRGQLFHWAPRDSADGAGAWERVAPPGEGAAHLIAGIPLRGAEPRVFVLMSSGELLRWDPLIAEGEARRGGLRAWAAVPARCALSAVALLAGGEEVDAPELILALRDGTFFGIGQDRRVDRWLAHLHDFDPGDGSARAEDRAQVRLRWAGRLSGDPGPIYAITEWEGLFASRDGGRVFTPVAGGLPKTIRCLTTTGGSDLLAGCADGLYRSPHAGGEWQACASRFAAGEAEGGEIRELLVAGGEAGVILARTARGQVLRSGDGGASWACVLAEVPLRVRSMATGACGGELVLATSRGALLSFDGGESWEWRNQGLRLAAVQAIAVGAGGRELFVGTDLGFFARTAGDGAWLPQLPCAALPASRSDASGERPATGRRRADGGQVGGEVGGAEVCGEHSIWDRLSGRIHALDLWEDVDSGRRTLCLGSESGPAVCLQDADGHCLWLPGESGGPATAVLSEPAGEAWAAGGAAGEGWLAHRPPLDEGRMARGEPLEAWRSAGLPDLAQAALDPDGPPAALAAWFAPGGRRLVLAGGGLVELAPGAARPLSGPAGCRVLTAAAQGSDLWVGTDDGLWRTDDGARWERIALAGERVGRVALAPGRPGTIACRAAGIVRLSVDGGASWVVVPVPELLHVQGLALDPAGSTLYLGTQHGLFAVGLGPASQPGGGAGEDDRALPLEAHPNPFTAQVVLRGPMAPREVEIGAPGSGPLDDAGGLPHGPDEDAAAGERAAIGADGAGAELRIVNVHGQLVRRILLGAHAVGEGEARYLEWQWDGRDERGQAAPRGIYVVSARVGRVSYRGKVIKLR